MSARLAIFGLDGADLDLLQPWLEDGSLPCLARLCRRGVCGRLASTIPPLSPEAWSSFATGCNPGRHGVINFAQPKPGSYDLRFSSGALRRGRALWQIAGDAGRRVGVVNVPMTYPPDAVNGFLISGPDAPGIQADFTHPGELKEELLAAVGRYDIHGDFWGRTTPDDYLERLIAAVGDQGRAWAYLLERFQPDLFIGVFGSTDRAQHFLWRHALPGGESALLAVYRAVDEAIAQCLEIVGEEATVIVMSDHGAGPCDSVVYLDRWLQQQGLLTYHERREGVARSLMRRGYQAARRNLPRWAKDWVKSKWRDARQHIEGSVLRDPIDWDHTRAFFLGTEAAYVYLNVRGRFPQGTVAPGSEAEALCDEIAGGLSRLRDPETGEPVVEAVHRRDEIYQGHPEHVALLPDLVVTWKDSRYVVRRAWGEPAASPEVIVERGIRAGDAGRLMSLELSACHRPQGVLIAAGPGIPAGREIRGAGIMDLAPTALTLLDIAPPAEMDGHPLPDLLGDRAVQRPSQAPVSGGEEPAPPDDPYTDTEKEELERRLRALGYLE